VIIGSGFAGLKLAQKINSRLFQVVLLDKNNFHTFQPLMYQVASAGLEPDSIVYPIRKIFKGKNNFHFRMTSVLSVNEDEQKIDTTLGSVQYDYLVIATGAQTNFFGLKNVEANAYSMKSIQESLDLRSIILQNFENALNTSDKSIQEAYMNFVIVGAGATGVELAGALAELKEKILPKDYPDLDINLMNIHLIQASDKVLDGMSENASNKALEFLKGFGINIRLNTFVKDYDGFTVQTNDGTMQSKTVIWSAGVKGAPVENIKGTLTQSRRIITDEFNRVVNSTNVYAIGDVSSIEGVNDGHGHIMLASVAGQQGAHLGKNFNNIASGNKMTPFKYKDRGTMATIGRNKAVVDLPFYKFSGIIAWFVWMFLHLMLLVDFRNRLIVFMNWTWSYFKYDKGLRLIIRKVEKREIR
jgi:NADH dehydrogenase